MPLTERIQNIIHQLEVGAGARYLRYFAVAVMIVALGLLYDLRAYRNFATPEAMDAAQLARNISEGKGYTTQFIRPFSLYLVQNHNQTKTPLALTNASFDFAQIKTAHPDLANPPVYPVVLAGLMKILPFNYAVNLKKPFWTNNGNFWRYQPDFYIAIFNEILLLIAVGLTFFLAKNLFDSNVAWLSAILMLGCELLWRFSTSGLPTILLLVIFLGLTQLLLAIEKNARAPQPRRRLGLVLAAGILTGIGALTRYAFGWVIIPVVLFLIFFSGPKRFSHALAGFTAFALVLIPWIVRNELVSGTMFGTAGFAIVEGTFVFPQFQLERSTHPELSQALWLTPYTQKFFANVRGILTNDLLKIGGGWAAILFFAGLFLGFRNLAARRLRYFLLMCLGVFIVVQALGRTQLSEMSPEINSENLLILLVPLVFVFAVSFFFTLLAQVVLPLRELRYAIVGLFVALCCLPIFFSIVWKTAPVTYPPYYPPEIQQAAAWMKPNELMMSDVPWAVTWYGDHQCVWLTLDSQDEFFAVNDYEKPIQGLYLTTETLDGKFFSEWGGSPKSSWGRFILYALSQNKPPPTFPLTIAAPHIQSGMFLTDRGRWKIEP